MTFERVVIICNPVSTHAERAARYVADVRAHFASAEVTVLETVRGGLAANEAHLRERAALFGPATLVGVVAGDGTFNMIVAVLMQLGGDAAQATFVPLWGGNANDLAHMLSGRAPKSLEPLLRKARPITVRPLECRLESANGQIQTRLAVCYASFGASAAAARRLGLHVRGDHPAHKIPGARFVREMGSVWLALKAVPAFKAEVGNMPQQMYECVVVNGSRLAKIGGLPLKISTEQFHAAVVGPKSSLLFGLRYLQMRSRRLAPRFVRQNLTFTILDDTWAQFDGETVAIAAGTHVSVALATAPLKLIALRAV